MFRSARSRRRPTASNTSTRCSVPTPHRSCFRSAARPSFPKPVVGWCATPAPTAGDGMWERAVRWWKAAPDALLEPWAGAVVNSADDGARVPRRGAVVAIARRHGARRRLGRRPVRAAGVGRSRAAASGQARPHAGARRRSERRRRLRCGPGSHSTRSTTAAASASNTSTSPRTAGRWKTPNNGPATSPRTSERIEPA